MRKFLILLLIVFFLPFVSAYYININNVTIDSFDSYLNDGDILVGSNIRYSISLTSLNETNFSENINVVVKNPLNEVIDSANFSIDFEPNKEVLISSEVGNEWRLIYAYIPGNYQIILFMESANQFFESKEVAYRHSNSLPIFFEVKSLQEKRMMDLLSQWVSSGDKMSNDMYSLTEKMYWLSLVMLVVSLITLFSTKSGQNAVVNFFKWVVIFFLIVAFFLLILLIIGFYIYS